MQNYTDDQLKLAILDASDQRNIFIRTAYSLEDIESSQIRSLRTLLYHLPDQQDDWQACAWADILPTDSRVKAEFIGGTVFEGAPDGIGEEGIHLVDGNFMPYEFGAKWYRIPAPVEHPDPEVDRVVVMHGWTRGYTEQCKPTKSIAMLYDGANYVGYDDGSGERLSLAPENITDWTPVDVVPKVVADE